MRTIGVLCFVGLLLGCGGSSTGPLPALMPSAPATSTTAVTVQATPALAFTPASVTIPVGGTVTFAFGSVAHNVFFDPQPGAPSDIPGANADTSIDVTFPTAGTFNFTCHIHPFMHGTVVVQ